jgi:trehalose 6-phosphate synthase
MWTEAQIDALARKSFKNKKLIIVSNRAPYQHVHRNEKVVCVSPAGGLTSALKPVVAAAGGTWVAQASGSADRETACRRGRLQVPPENPAFTLRRLWVPGDLQHAYYEGLSNQALWPLCHNVYRQPVFRKSDWEAYRKVNELFAQAVIEEAGDTDAAVFVQDYHLALLPRILKSRNPELTVAQFWHIPWPAYEKMRTFPWLDELIEGMLGNDLLAFHLPAHCANFVETAESTLETQTGPGQSTIWHQDHSTVIRDAPISIDFASHSSAAASPEVERAMQIWKQRLGDIPSIGVGIDRIDYTKGIPERLRALGLLLEQNPHLRGNLTFVQVGVPSRSGIAAYADLERAIDVEVAAINKRWGTEDWKPIVFEKRNLGQVEMMALHRLADFCMVTSLHDGMNLVAKEFVASRFDGDGVLVLSRFAGSDSELRTAVPVNPFSQDSLCDAISTALTMPLIERRRRMAVARAVVQTNNIYRWAGTLIEEINELSRRPVPPKRFVHFGKLSANVA